MRFFSFSMFHLIGAGTVLLVSTLLSMWAPDLTQAELLKRYGQDTQWVELQQGVRIHYKETGAKEAPAILLLHGFGASLQTWDAWANSLSSNYRVIRPDLPGFGLTLGFTLVYLSLIVLIPLSAVVLLTRMKQKCSEMRTLFI